MSCLTAAARCNVPKATLQQIKTEEVRVLFFM